MEKKDAEDLFKSEPVLFGKHFTISDLSDDSTLAFWMDMQQIHDEQEVEDWDKAFRSYASTKGLTYASTR